MRTPRELKTLYEQGVNVSALLREEEGLGHNTEEIIELSYDLQAGSYVAALDDDAVARHKREYGAEIARRILDLGEPESVLEAGVGEATTLAMVLGSLGQRQAGYGFDLSWSRLACGREWLRRQELSEVTLVTGSLLHIPFADRSVDVVYTSHSVEPNGGSEEPILRELYRVARRYLVLLEPGWELAGEAARRRMESHGYCKNLPDIARSFGWEVVVHEPFPHVANPLNPTALTVIRKGAPESDPPSHVLACPRFGTPLEELGGALFSPEALVVYPIVGGIPCLKIGDGILASRYREMVRLPSRGVG